MIDRPAPLLVIDDDPLFRTLIAGCLKSNFRVATASDGHQGFGLALAERPAAIILDLIMPKWDGVQTLRVIRAEPKLDAVPVLVLTGDEDPKSEADIRNLGVQFFISKSQFSREILLETVNEVCPVSPVSPPHTVQPHALAFAE